MSIYNYTAKVCYIYTREILKSIHKYVSAFLFIQKGGEKLGLNQRQERFCQEYAKTGNATQSMIAAGYSENWTNTHSTKMLQNATIQNRLKELTSEIKNENIADAKEMQEILTSIIRQQLEEQVIVVEGVDKGITEAVTKTKTASMKDIVSAIDKLARMQGCYNDKMTVDVTVPVFKGDDDLDD